MSQMLTVFAFIAIFIGCLGLYGLVSFMANQKAKEIDIRKVLGATVASRQLRLRDILHMQPGDVIPVELPDQVIMRANGVPAFNVKLGAHKGKLAFQVLDPIERIR